jgi:epoxyqueuosine reductase
MRQMKEELLTQLERRGCRAKIVSTEHLSDIREEIQSRHTQGLFDEDFFNERLSWFDFQPSSDLPDAKFVIVVAFPQPKIGVIFNKHGERKRLILPPTYLEYPIEEVEKILSDIMNPEGYFITPVALPLKLLAVRSGLGRYGRNNICYVDGIGSFHRLMAFYTDYPFAIDDWGDEHMLELCEKCQACIHACPGGVITPERFLIHAERCLTFHNERANDFPSWIDPSWHHCIVGCLHCQRVCPQNKKHWNWMEDREEFSEEETALLLVGITEHNLPHSMEEKLEQLSLIEYLDVLPRNLKVLLDRKNK